MSNKINKKYIKELIVNYLNSIDIEIVFIYNDEYFCNSIYGYSDSIKMNNLVDYYLTENSYYYDVTEIKNVDVFELIKIFLNIFCNSKTIFTKYKKYYIKNKLNLSIDKKKLSLNLVKLIKKFIIR